MNHSLSVVFAVLSLCFNLSINAQHDSISDFEFMVDGRVQVKGALVYGRKEGAWEYTPKKDYYIRGSYRHGKMNGPWVYTLDDDTLAVMNFKDGYQEGERIGYYPKGGIFSKMNFKVGVRSGQEMIFYPDGTVKEMLTYMNGKPIGNHLYYNPDGTLYGTIVYEKASFAGYEGFLDSGKTIIISEKEDVNQGFILLVTELSRTTYKRKLLFELKKPRNSKKAEAVYYWEDGTTKRLEGAYELTETQSLKKTGIWTEYHKSGEVSRVINFKRTKNIGVLDEIALYDGDSRYKAKQTEEHRRAVGAFMSKWIKRLYSSPKGVSGSGKVYVGFKVNQLGETFDVKVEYSLNKAFNDHALKMIRSFPLFEPEFRYGLPASPSHHVLPLNFQQR